MRRVVTGDQIAQLRNPDPFAVPAWRSPVYRTPLWIVAIVHAARLLGLAGAVPVPSSGPGPGRHHRCADVAGDRLARPGGPGREHRRRAGAVAVAVPRLVLPLHWHPGSWPVAGLALPAPLGRGDDHRPPRPGLPGPGAAARPRQGFGNPLHRPGAGPAGVGPVRGRLRRPGRQPGPRVRRHAVPDPLRLARVRWCWSSSAATPWPPSSPPWRSPLRWICGRCRSAAARTARSGWSGCTAPTC